MFIQTLFVRIDKALSFRWSAWLLLGTISLIYTWAYITYPVRPGNLPEYPEGWIGWWDQGQYYKSAWAIAKLSLSKDSFWYPPGYSLLAAPFTWITREHPFFVPNLACTLISAASLYQIALRIITRVESVLLLIAFVTTHSWFLSSTQVVPWNTIPTQAIFLFSTFLLLTVRNRSCVIWLSVLAGFDYLIRPSDAAFLAPMLIYATLRLPTWRQRLASGSLGVLIIGTFVSILFLLHYKLFGSWESPYEEASYKIGFFAFPLSIKAYWLLLDGLPFFRESTPGLFLRYPWLLLAPAGMIYWIRREGWSAVAVLSTVSTMLLFYFSYNDLNPANIYRFLLIHYLSGFLLLFALLAYAGLSRGWRTPAARIALLCTLLAVAPLLCLQLVSTPLQPQPESSVSTNSLAFDLPPHGLVTVAYRSRAPIATRLATTGRLDVFQNGLPLLRFTGYSLPYLASNICLFGNPTPSHYEILVPDAEFTGKPELGQLIWAWRFIPTRVPMLAEAFSFFSSATDVPNSSAMDLTGPNGQPDSIADAIISVRAPSRILSIITEWDIVSLDRPGHWTSAANPNGWWPVLPVVDHQQSGLVSLYFPSSSDYSDAQEVKVVARDASKHILLELIIRK